MNTKSKLFLLSIVVIALVTVGAYFVFHATSKAYLKALPRDIVALARLDVKEFLDDADFSQDEMRQLVKRLSASANDPSSFGFDFTSPLYGFASQDGYFGVLAAVAQADDVASWCERLRAEGHASEVSKQRGYSWVVLDQQWLMAFDEEKALAMGPAVGAAQDQLRTVIARLLEQDRDESGLESELYDVVSDAKSPMAAVVSSEILPEEVLQPMRAMNLASAAQGMYLFSLAANRNELDLDVEIIPANEDGEAELEYLNILLRPIHGALTEYAHEKNVLWMAANLKGESLLELLRSHLAIRTVLVALNFVIDADRILESVDGDIALEIMDGGSSLENIGGALTAQVANTDFLSGASKWGNKYVTVQALSSTEYSIAIPDMPLFFSVQDNVFHLGSERSLPTQGNAYLREESRGIKGARFYATIDLRALSVEPIPYSSTLLKSFERLNVKMERAGKLLFTLKAPEGTYVLKEILDIEH